MSFDGPSSMETFRRAVADTETALAALQRQSAGADDGVSAVVDSLIGHLKSSDALLVPVLGSQPGAWSRAHTAAIITIVALRIGMELEYTHPALSHLGQAALLHELGTGEQARADDGTLSVPADYDAKIVAVAATYAHLSRQLPAGRRTWPPAAVKEILRRGRARFPDAILKALIQISVQFPVGGFVRLNSGELARVVAKNAGLPLRPVVIVAGRRTRQPAEPKRVDLRDNPFLFIVEFLGAEALDADPETRWS
jgi:hypothetical protein